jgi:hypothetical protein
VELIRSGAFSFPAGHRSCHLGYACVGTMAGLSHGTYADQFRRVRWLGDTCSEESTINTEDLSEIYDRPVASNGLHPTRAMPGEELPEGYSRSYTGFLLQNQNREVEVDQDVVRQEMDYLAQFVVIASFIGGKPPEHMLQQWLSHLQTLVSGTLTLGHNMGKGFFVIKAGNTDTVRQLLLLTPHRLSAGFCVFQRWAPGFDLNGERGMRTVEGKKAAMKIPTWIALLYQPDEFRGVAPQIAASLGELLRTNSNNNDRTDPRFCVAIDSSAG